MMYFLDMFRWGQPSKMSIFRKSKIILIHIHKFEGIFNLCNHCFLIEQTMTEWQNIQPLVQVIGRGRKKDLVIYVFYFRLWWNFKLRHGKKKRGGAEKRTQLLTTWMSFCLLIHDYWVGVNANLTIQHLCVFIFCILTTRLILQTHNKRRNCTWLHFTFTHSLQKDKRKNYAVILQALSEPFIVCNIRLCTIHYPTIESRELKKNVFLLWKKTVFSRWYFQILALMNLLCQRHLVCT